MLNFKKITVQTGFDSKDLINAHQNNYAWSMAELGDYVYVGTGRNLIANAYSSIDPGFKPSMDYLPAKAKDNTAEIWRYKKDGTGIWELVLKTDLTAGVLGFRYMISYNPSGLEPTLYAASTGLSVKIYKSTNGTDWFELLTSATLLGGSSRAMVVHKGKLYLANVESALDMGLGKTYIYSSMNPELEGWKLEVIPEPTGDQIGKNVRGSVQMLASFNGHLYAATCEEDGISIWRTEGDVPEQGKWKLVFDKGGGDGKNVFSASMGIFKNYLYLGTGIKSTSMEALANPVGSELFRIGKDDKWELVVGGTTPVKSTSPTTGTRKPALSGYDAGFNNRYNFYMWQVVQYGGQLLVGTYDHSNTVQTNLEMFKKNYDLLFGIMGTNVDNIINSLAAQATALSRYPQTLGFDMYTSIDGVHFTPITINGLGNSRNYGARMFLPSTNGKLYIGSANPFQGCEVWEAQETYYDYAVTLNPNRS